MQERGILRVESRRRGGLRMSSYCFEKVVLFRRVLPIFILLCLLVNGVLFASVFRHLKVQDVLVTLESHQDDFLFQHVEEEDPEPELDLDLQRGTSPAWLLIEETRDAIAAAGGVPGSVMLAEEAKAWDFAHSCEGRQHLLRLWGKEKRLPRLTNNTSTTAPRRSEPSPLLRILFREYTNLHRTCTHGGDMEYVTGLFQSSNESSPCKFLVVEYGPYGVGNRLLWTVSAYLYALLSKRVLLIDTRSTVHKLVCEPFQGSSWLLPEDFPYSSEFRWPMSTDFQSAWDRWENNTSIVGDRIAQETNLGRDGLRDLSIDDIDRERKETRARIRAEVLSKAANSDWMSRTKPGGERRLSEEKGDSVPLPHFHHSQANDGWAPNPRFFCDNEQEHLDRVKWVSLSKGCLYFLPDLFAVPSFQPALEELFPNRDPVTHLLRLLTIPVDSIWTKVREIYSSEFLRASKVVGMQVRYREGIPMYRNLNAVVNERISKCGKESGLIPDPVTTSTQEDDEEGPVVIYIASLYPGLRQHLENVYEKTLKKRNRGRNPAMKLLQLSNFGFQAFDVEGDHQALVEIVCLSLVDELLTTPQSTYGEMAQALGGLTPWLIDFRSPGQEESLNCVRGQSTDACYQFAIPKFTCPFDKDLDGRPMSDLAPYLKPCQYTDGLQLVPPWSPSLLPS